MKTDDTALQIPYINHREDRQKGGVTVFGINETADAFEPLFTMDNRADAEMIVKKLCKACEIDTCPDWKRAIQVCYNIIDHHDG